MAERSVISDVAWAWLEPVLPDDPNAAVLEPIGLRPSRPRDRKTEYGREQGDIPRSGR